MYNYIHLFMFFWFLSIGFMKNNQNAKISIVQIASGNLTIKILINN